MTYEIESGIPIPPPAGGRGCKGGFGVGARLAAAKIGDSIFINTPGLNRTGSGYFQQFGKGWTTSRKEGSGRRFWKIAEPSHPKGDRKYGKKLVDAPKQLREVA